MWHEPRASLGLNVVTVMVLRAAALPRRSGTNAMSQQWPDPNDPQPIQQPPGEPPTAPHAPESPRETPQPRDPQRGPGGKPAPDIEQA